MHVVIGCGLAPGLSDVLARHAAGALDTVDEIHVSRLGRRRRPLRGVGASRADRDPGLEWRDGAYLHDRSQGAQLVWFPDPVGARECELVATGVELLVAAHPGVERVTARLGAPVESARPQLASVPTATRPHRGVGLGPGRGLGPAGRRARRARLRGDRAHRGRHRHRARRGRWVARHALPRVAVGRARCLRPRPRRHRGAVPRRARAAGREGGGVRGRGRRLTTRVVGGQAAGCATHVAGEPCTWYRVNRGSSVSPYSSNAIWPVRPAASAAARR